MACIFPGARDLDSYWENIFLGRDCVTEPPAGRWITEKVVPGDATSLERSYTDRGGYLHRRDFDSSEFGIPFGGADPEGFVVLRLAQQALADAGYDDHRLEKERTRVFLGHGDQLDNGQTQGEALQPSRRAGLHGEARERLADLLSQLGPDVAVDAGCASSVIAIDLALRDLVTRKCELALVAGIHLNTTALLLSTLCQVKLLSRRGEIRPFDTNADGTLPGEGAGVIVLKRRKDAERNGGRIYAVIKGVGTSSNGDVPDGLVLGKAAQESASKRAYEAAGIDPETIELLEAHGAATPPGDLTEIQALRAVFGSRKGALPTCALGSVKSMIGHLLPAAAIASIIKTALALHHKVLPPTLHCEAPDPGLKLGETPFYINTTTRPWIHGNQSYPRRAAANTFDFGGINAHLILEEYVSKRTTKDLLSMRQPPNQPARWESEVCIVQGASRQDLIRETKKLAQSLGTAASAQLRDVAYALNKQMTQGTLRLAVVASSIPDLRVKLAWAAKQLLKPETRRIKDLRGIYFFAEPLELESKVAFLFPGEMSQYPNMLRDLALHFPEVRQAFDSLESLARQRGVRMAPSSCIFPVAGTPGPVPMDAGSPLWQMTHAEMALMTANRALYRLLERLKIRPDILLGHSSGEFSAMAASGIILDEDLFGERLLDAFELHEDLPAQHKPAAVVLTAVGSDRASVTELLAAHGGLRLAMDNCPHQVVIVGEDESMGRAVQRLQRHGIICQRLPFNRPYHTDRFAAVAEPIINLIQELPLASPKIAIYSSSTMGPYPADPKDIRNLLGNILSRPVEFRGSIEAVYERGARIFLEVGAGGRLTAFVDDILRGRPYVAVACDLPSQSGIHQLNHVLGILAAHGVGMRLDYLYERRSPMLASEVSVIRHPAGEANRLGSRKPPPVEPDAGTGFEDTEEAPKQATAQVMQQYMENMRHFLEVEEMVMEAFLEGPAKLAQTHSAMTHPAEANGEFPFIGTVVSRDPGHELLNYITVDPNEALFLADHCLGARRVSQVDVTLTGLAVMPFTMFMEMMAETASLLMPGKLLIAMQQIEVRRWLKGNSPSSLEITARRQPSGNDVAVSIRNLGSGPGEELPQEGIIARGTVIFGEGYLKPEPPAPLALFSERRCDQTAEQVYEKRILFHGPRFQALTWIDRLGENGIIAHVRGVRDNNLFRTAVRLLTDPVLLDAGGQLMGLWARERYTAGVQVLPFCMAGLEIYGPRPQDSEELRCEVEISQRGARQLTATINFFGADGRLSRRLVGLQQWRFFWSGAFRNFRRYPERHLFSEPWEEDVGLTVKANRVCQRLDLRRESSLGIARDVVAYQMLSRAERQEFEVVNSTDWLFSRAVAKDAVRRLLARSGEEFMYPADIEIIQDHDAQPAVRMIAPVRTAIRPSVAVDKSDGLAVALAVDCARGEKIGLCVGRLGASQQFHASAVSSQELRLVKSKVGAIREEWLARLWCAKGSVARALGEKTLDNLAHLEVCDVDFTTGTVEITLRDEAADVFRTPAHPPFVAETGCQGDYVMSATILEGTAR